MEMKLVGGILCLASTVLIGATVVGVGIQAMPNGAAIAAGLASAILMAGGFLYLGDKE